MWLRKRARKDFGGNPVVADDIKCGLHDEGAVAGGVKLLRDDGG